MTSRQRNSKKKATLYRFVGGLVELPFTGRSDMALRRLVQGVNVVLLLSSGATNMRKRKKSLPTLPADFTNVQALPIPLFAACSEQHEETDGIGRAARLRRVIVHAKAKPA
jgi:hypothetical protein